MSIDCLNVASLIKNPNNNNNSASTSSSFGFGHVAPTKDAQNVIDLLRNDTLDVLECGDFEKVVSDCAEDCINLMTDSLEQSFQKISIRTIKRSNNKWDKNENSMTNKKILNSLDEDKKAKMVSNSNGLEDGK